MSSTVSSLENSAKEFHCCSLENSGYEFAVFLLEPLGPMRLSNMRRPVIPFLVLFLEQLCAFVWSCCWIGKRPPSGANDSDGNAAKKGRVVGGGKDLLMNRALGGISYGGRSSGRGRGRGWAGRSRGSGRGRSYW
ncbi:hypothetical protein Droror1_Dr00010280 [Drosera rotundifolia]